MNRNYHPDDTPRPEGREVIILGGGVAGLAAASALGKRAVVFERQARPGGLVRTECFQGYWFDRVLHLLYFSDSDTERRIKQILDRQLAWCPPSAWVETGAGTVRYPFQLHLFELSRSSGIRCLLDLALVRLKRLGPAPANFEEMLLALFGRGMCEAFFFPYNRKLWKRPLDSLAPSAVQWNIAKPGFLQVAKGALTGNCGYEVYNARGWYPRPPEGAPLRGMEVLSQKLAGGAADLRLCHDVEAIDVSTRTVWVRHRGRKLAFRYRNACGAAIPLTRLIGMIPEAPECLKQDCRRLLCNRVVSTALSIRGPRPEGTGHWRYYADPALIFNRLIFMHQFDPDMAPENGWGLLAEVTEPAEQPPGNEAELLRRVVEDVIAANALPSNSEIIDAHTWHIDPAYVVFTRETAGIIERALEYLKRHHITPLGRYGRWEYSSMSQVMRDSFAWAASLESEKD